MGSRDLPTALLTVAWLLFSWFSWKAYLHRARINALRKAGVPMPPWNWLWGHIFFFYQRIQRLPTLLNASIVFEDIGGDFAEEEMFLLDLWPFMDSSLVVFNPEAAVEICQKLDLPKTEKNATMIQPITGGLTLLSMNGAEWKTWRGFFNAGFSPSMMLEHVPEIVDSASRLCDKLRSFADNGVVCLDEHMGRSTFEVICKVLLNMDVAPEGEDHVLARTLGNIINWHSFWDPLVLLNPMRVVVQWYNGRILNNWVTTKMKSRFEQLKKDRADTTTKKPRTKTVMDIATEAYTNLADDNSVRQLDDHFLRKAAHHVRLFLFVGSDSTSSTIIFALHLLHKNPEALRKLQEEHSSIFGDDPENAPRLLRESPALLNKCKYTLAVTKEVLRMYPAAATMRKGDAVTLRTQNGINVPCDNLAIIIPHHPLHRNSRIWPRPHEFIPERWLVGPDHELYPRSNTWRPFELGPRNCIGQNLALNEIKVVLIMAMRTIKIEPAYKEWDSIQGKEEGLLKRVISVSGLGSGKVPPKTYRGDRAFPTDKAGGHPSDGYPCRISVFNK